MDVSTDCLEEKVLNLLSDLKEKHHLLSIKSEFEDEGASLEEITLLNNIVQKIGIDLTIKIGGCGAINDIRQAKKIGAKTIVAPMVESPYALEKFIKSIDILYQKGYPELFINIETVFGYNNFDEILSADGFEKLSGVVLGRFDMAKSIGLECKDCNGKKLFEIADVLAQKVYNTGKIFAVGGGICAESLKFFSEISYPVNRFETRKVIFDADKVIANNDQEAILKAINFELLWLKFKNESFGLSNVKDSKRIEILEKRCKGLLPIH